MHDYEAGQTIFAIGDPPGGIVGLVSGGVIVSVVSNESGPFASHVSRPGWWFGEGCFILGGSRRADLTCLTACTIAKLSLAEMEHLSQSEPGHMRSFAQIAMLNLELTLQATADLLLPRPHRRIAAILWRMSGAEIGYRLPVTQRQLGELANTSRKQTIASVSLLIKQGALLQKYGAIEIRDAALLRQIADTESE
ncbi:Crp/Fnr family transcriptional regulator [Citreimonas sp.]|uniref:Crp/Fnr family transcriptional regulator n=1 Tax=Citreimonas sp. TaxID=3036715 RepID=UPI0040587097